MKNEIIFKMMCSPKTKIKRRQRKTRFVNSNRVFECPISLGMKIMKAIKKSRYKLAREMIDIYKDMFVANF